MTDLTPESLAEIRRKLDAGYYDPADIRRLLAALAAERARNRELTADAATAHRLMVHHANRAENLEAVAEAAQNFTGEMGHSHACEFRKYNMGWKKGDPPIIRCVCGLDALAAALAVLEEPQ